MANKKKKSSNNNKTTKKITVEDLKKKNINVKKKNGSSNVKLSSNKNKSVPEKNATVVNKNAQKKEVVKKKNVELDNSKNTINNKNSAKVNKNSNNTKKNKSVKNKNKVKNNYNNQSKNSNNNQVKEKEIIVSKDEDNVLVEKTKENNIIKKEETVNVLVSNEEVTLKEDKNTIENVSDTLKETVDGNEDTKKKLKDKKKKNTIDIKKIFKKRKDIKKKTKTNKNKDISTENKKKKQKKVYKSSSDVEKEIKYARRKNILKNISFICFLIIIVECGIFFYIKFFKVGDNSYDALNTIVLDKTSLVSVGSSYFKYSSNYDETGRIEKGRLIRYDKRGKLELEVQYDRGINSTFTSVVMANDGYYVVGSGEFSKEQEKNHTRDALLIKYSLDGKKLWEKSYSVLSDTRFNKIIAVADGLVVVGQSIYENMEMGNHTTGGGIIVKYDFDGNLVWSSNHGGNKSGNFNDVITIGGNYYVVGKDSKDTGVLVKFSSDGKYVFHKNYSYTDNLGFSSITTDGTNIYAVGSKKILSEEEQNDENSKRDTNNTDALIVKYSTNGEILKEKIFGGSGHDRYNSVVYYGGYLYLVGSTASNDSGLRVSSKNGEVTAMLIKCDTSLAISRKEVFGGSNDDNMLDLVTDGSNVYMVGYSNSKDSNIKTEHDNGSDFISKLIKVDYRFRILMKK